MRILAAIMALLIASTALAQVQRRDAAPVPSGGFSSVPAGKLMRIDEGVFDLEIGKTIDLTNSKILLAPRAYREGCCEILLNGRGSVVKVGERIDLKDWSSTKLFVGDRTRCFLDVVDFVKPQGGQGTVTFRLECI